MTSQNQPNPKPSSPEEIQPQIGTSILMSNALPTTSVQTGTTILIDNSFATVDRQTGTSVLKDALLPKVDPPRVSMLGDATPPKSEIPPKVSVLPNDLLPSIPPPKMPRLVKDMEK